VSLTTGWVLGGGTCGASPCVQVWRTDDGGRTWTDVPVPPAPAPLATNAEIRPLIRFANRNDGWVAASGKLWATHDGGAHWNEQSITSVYALEASAGSVHAIVPRSGENGFGFLVATSPVHTDAWRLSATEVDHGAGPAARAQLVLHGRSGWLVIVNRALVGGARLQNGEWVTWKAPCEGDGTPVELAASTASDLVAFCLDGTWNDRPPGQRIFVSTDGGSSSRPVQPAPPFRDAYAVAAATPAIWVVGSAETAAGGDPIAVLRRTADGGRTWKTVHRGAEQSGWIDVGFTNSEQGVAINEGEVDRLFMTFDGGQTWGPVATR
jgi:photosystem II stability/assembly factor-like uncharacterized protein